MILTPHIGEMSRLCGKEIGDPGCLAQTALIMQRSLERCAYLKDACTVMADANGDMYLNISGNSGMATAGSGDVLTGDAWQPVLAVCI